MEELLERQFRTLIKNSGLEQDIQERLLLAIKKLSAQEQAILFQLFQKYPEKISEFWKVSLKKFEYIKNGIGNLDDILQEEIELFS
jgi:hypothetical protein